MNSRSARSICDARVPVHGCLRQRVREQRAGRGIGVAAERQHDRVATRAARMLSALGWSLQEKGGESSSIGAPLIWRRRYRGPG